METWQLLLRDSITTYDDLKKQLGCDNSALQEVIAQFPLRINPYFLKRIRRADDPLWLQAVPSPAELDDPVCMTDPLGEEDLSPVPNLVHKYPDRALFLVTGQCAMYCRFCTRKRKVGTNRMSISGNSLEAGFNYLRDNPKIREVLLSGGDPLLLEDEVLAEILYRLKAIPSIEVIRIGTRAPSTLPMRITPKLVQILRQFHPVYINTHFNHPDEITPEASKACTMLADGGIPMGCQTVLLRGINDNSETLKKLFLSLLRIRVKPYYLFQADLTRGTNHFRTTTREGIAIMRSLYGYISGMAIPTFALDGPGGKGKIPLSPQYIVKQDKNLVFKNYCGEICTYPEAGEAI